MAHLRESMRWHTGGGTGTYDQESSDEEDGGAVDQESREAIERSFQAICSCLVAQESSWDDVLGMAETLEMEAQARLDIFGSSHSNLVADDWVWLKSFEEDCQEELNQEEAFLQTSELRRLLDLLRASQVDKDEAHNHESATVEEIVSPIARELKAESDRFMQEVLTRVAFGFRYKQRSHVGRAVHIVVLQRDAKAAVVLRDLLSFKVNVEHRCTNNTFGRVAHALPIHLAAGGGHVDTLKTIIDLDAAVDAKTKLGKDEHYTALHEACFFQRIQAVKKLIASKADVDCKNFSGDTPLHLAAKLAPSLAEVLVKSKADVTESNNRGQRPVDLAIEHANFPVREMHFLTSYSLADLARVAKQSPLAASELMRDPASDDWEYKVNPRWRESLAKEAERGQEVCQVWCQLMDNAPQAAEALLEALTLEPHVEDKFNHPLPRYAMLGSYETLRSLYAPDRVWRYHADSETHVPDWHLDASTGLAPQLRGASLIGKDGRDSDAHKVSINIKVLMIPDMLCSEVFLRLKTTNHLHIFIKIAVRAILEYVWQKGVATFYFAELGHKSLVIAVLLWWVLEPPPHEFWVRATWSFLFAAACRELCYEFLEIRGFLMVAINDRFGGRKPFMRFIQCWLSVGNVFDLSTSFLLFWLVVHLWGRVDAESLAAIKEMLAVVVLTRWLQLAGAYRAFPSVGQKLIPIVQSIAGMGGILFLTVLTFSAFLHAFCALSTPDVTTTQLFVNSVRFLFVGDGDGIDMVLGLGGGSAADPSPWAVLILVSALFLFCILLLNIFIATTDQAYEQALEFVQTRFLQERASICFECLFRPCLPHWCRRRLKLSAGKLWCILLLVILPTWLGMLTSERFPLWVPSSMLALMIAFLDAAMVHPPWHEHSRKPSPSAPSAVAYTKEPLGSPAPWTSHRNVSSLTILPVPPPCVPGMVAEQQHPDASLLNDEDAKPLESSIPLPRWAQLPVKPPPSATLPQQQALQPPLRPPPERDVAGGQRLSSRSSTYSRAARCTAEGMYLWICHSEDCSEIDLWPAAGSLDSAAARLEGRVSSLKRDGMMRSRKTESDILGLRRCTESLQGSVGREAHFVRTHVAQVEDRLANIEKMLKRLSGEAAGDDSRRSEAHDVSAGRRGRSLRRPSEDPSKLVRLSAPLLERGRSRSCSPRPLE